MMIPILSYYSRSHSYAKPSSDGIFNFILFLFFGFIALCIIVPIYSSYKEHERRQEFLAERARQDRERQEYLRKKEEENKRYIAERERIHALEQPLVDAVIKLEKSMQKAVRPTALEKDIIVLRDIITDLEQNHAEVHIRRDYYWTLSRAEKKYTQMKTWEAQIAKKAPVQTQKPKKPVNPERKKMTASLRYEILKRDGFRCQICGRSADDGIVLHVDHIIPVSKGGKTEPDNLRTLCQDCNLGKRDKLETVSVPVSCCDTVQQQSEENPDATSQQSMYSLLAAMNRRDLE